MPRQKSRHVDDPAAVGRRLRAAREDAGLTQRALAFTGCSAAYISRIEAGARIPSLQLLRELGRRLGVSAEYLAGDEGTSAADAALRDATLAQRLGDTAAARAGFTSLASSDDLVVRAAALRGLGELALLDGDVAQAIVLLEEHERLAPAKPVEASAVEAIVHAYATRGDRPQAIALLERKLELAADDPLVAFRLSVLFANALIDLGELDRAEVVVGDALASLGASPDPISLARCLWSQSRLQTARGAIDRAADYAEQALTLIKSTEHEAYAARAHHLLAYIELERGNAERALELIESALPAIHRGGDQTLLALFRVEHARALAATGDTDQAQELAAELVRDVEHLSRVDAARSLAVLAGVFASGGDSDRALELYEAAADALADLDHAPMLLDVYAKWSDLLAERGETEAALAVARRALAARSGSAAS
jgi:transcriptional regulator with XRE-family HTH domain